MGLSFFRDTVTVLRAPIITVHGEERRNWRDPEEIIIKNVQVTARSTTQDRAGRLQNINDGRTLRADYDADIREGDRVIFEGNTYEVNGEVYHTKSPTGRVSSTRCALTRWEG